MKELKALLRIPSVSTDPEHVGDVRRAAEFVAAELKRIGMEVNVWLIETTTPEEVIIDVNQQARMVRGAQGIRWFTRIGHLHAGEREGYGALLRALRCAVLTELLDEWKKSPPLEPTERDGNIYARGAVG